MVPWDILRELPWDVPWEFPWDVRWDAPWVVHGRAPWEVTWDVPKPYKRPHKEDALSRIPSCSENASMVLPLLGSLRLEEELLCLRVGGAL